MSTAKEKIELLKRIAEQQPEQDREDLLSIANVFERILKSGIRVHALRFAPYGTGADVISASSATTIHNATLIVDKGKRLPEPTYRRGNEIKEL